jgi:hypothetical protein
MHKTRLSLTIFLLFAGAARADAPVWFGQARVGYAIADTPPAWHEGGLGRYLADDDDAAIDVDAQLAMNWEPNPDWRVFVQALARGDSAGTGQHIGLVEAYLDRNLFLADDSRLRLRAGQFFLPTSREAVDPLWQSRYTLTLSALNSWIAEEFRPLGLDLSWRNRADAAHEWELAATAIAGNDSSGALLAWRGFAQHDRLSTLGEVLPLPALPTLATGAEFGGQRDDGSRPFGRDLDGRIGYAVRARLADPERLRVLATWVDTRGDRDLHRGEYAWRTRFAIVGAEYLFDPRWTLAGEWLSGRSGMGFAPGPRVDLDFDTAYLLASFAPSETWRFSARVEQFRIRDRDGVAENNDDTGHALAFAAFRTLGASWRAGVEWTDSDTRHAASALVNTAPETGGRQWRIELRRSF